ncbi:MAG: type II toxin-antitoxin system VapC family toxin [Saprospiraceae bacterium]
MVLCDTNIFISAFNGRIDTIDQLNKIGIAEIALSPITVMELFQGMKNKKELLQMQHKIVFYDVIHLNRAISTKSILLIENYKLSHGLTIPDAIIAATAIVYEIPLFTYNLKDFTFIPTLNLHPIPEI